MSDITNERLVLAALVKDEKFMRTLLPFIRGEYFEDAAEARMFKMVFDYCTKYNQLPDKSTMIIEAKNDYSLSEGQSDRVLEVVHDVFSISPGHNFEWLKKTTEEFCQNRAVYNAIQKSISIYQGEDKTMNVGAIPDLLAKAISVNFQTKIGMDYYDDAAARFDFYANPESRVPFRISDFNKMTCGGVVRKTLNLLVAGVNVGKTLGLVSLSADYVRDGLNVLYISGEMREEMIMNRFDANMLGVNVNEIVNLGKEKFVSRVEGLRQKSYGQFKVIEFAPGQATAMTIKNAVDDLKLKKNFIPDVIVCDYLQIMGSYRMAFGSQGSYYYFKAVAEELRALAVETNTVVWSAAQFNRGGMSATEVGMDDIAESTGIAQTADGMWAVIRTEELDQVGQLLIKQLKSRYANKSAMVRFTIGVDVDKQSLFDSENNLADTLMGPEKAIPQSQSELRDKFQRNNKFDNVKT